MLSLASDAITRRHDRHPVLHMGHADRSYHNVIEGFVASTLRSCLAIRP